jgi:nucleoside-diphosphate-sugar epimerase
MRHIVPMLVANGHQVIGATRTPDKAQGLPAAGAEPVVVDLVLSKNRIDAQTEAVSQRSSAVLDRCASIVFLDRTRCTSPRGPCALRC